MENENPKDNSIEKMLGSRARIKILKLLALKQELSMTQIIKMTKFSRTVVKKHLDVLESNNLIEEKTFGRIKIYKYMESGICPECGNRVISNDFEQMCNNCGLVLGHQPIQESAHVISEEDNKRQLNNEKSDSEERSDYTGGFETSIDRENSKYLRDKTGKLLPPDEQKLYRRLKKNYAQFLRIKNHETEYRIFNILNKVSIYLNLNKNIRNNAAYYYKKIIKNEGKVINNISLIAFCIFYAVRRDSHNAPVTINEISNVFQNFGHRVNPRLILRDGIRYKAYLNDENIPHKSEDYLVRLVDNVINHELLDDRMEKQRIIWSKRDYRYKLLEKSRFILNNLDKRNRAGHNPFILTGAVIYLADKLLAKDHKKKPILTQKIISEATKIAEYSIRNHYINVLKPLFLPTD